MLGLHPAIQEKVYRELDEIFDCKPGDGQPVEASGMNCKLRTTNVTGEHLARMKYLEMVVKESLRMWPSVPFVGRQLSEDIAVGKWTKNSSHAPFYLLLDVNCKRLKANFPSHSTSTPNLINWR